MGIILPKQVGTEEGRLLFQKSEKVEDFNQGRKIVDSLKKTLEYYGGVGLAAPQIGISRRVFVVNIMPTKDYPQLPTIGFCAYLNPEIIVVSPEVNSDLEGCLSIFYATLYINHPFHTRVVLHENDHLEGKVFLQRMKEGDFPKLYWEENLDIRKRNSE